MRAVCERSLQYQVINIANVHRLRVRHVIIFAKKRKIYYFQFSFSIKMLPILILLYSGLPSLVDFLEPDFNEFKDLIYNSLDAIWNIFELQTPTPKRAFCYLFVKSGLLSRLSIVLVNLAKVHEADAEADSYLQTVVKILLFFSKSDAQVTEKMCSPDVLQRKSQISFLGNLTSLTDTHVTDAIFSNEIVAAHQRRQDRSTPQVAARDQELVVRLALAKLAH